MCEICKKNRKLILRQCIYLKDTFYYRKGLIFVCNDCNINRDIFIDILIK